MSVGIFYHVMICSTIPLAHCWTRLYIFFLLITFYNWCISWIYVQLFTSQVLCQGGLCHSTPCLHRSLKGGEWRLAFQTRFWMPLRGGLISGEGWEDPSLPRVRLLDEEHDCMYPVLNIMLRTLPFFTHAEREAPGLCSGTLVDLSLPAAAVFRSELLQTACWFSRGLFFFILGVIVYYFILAKATRCILLWGKKDKQISERPWRKRQAVTRVLTLAYTSGGDGNWQWKKPALPGEKSHQTKPEENGNVVEEAFGAGIFPKCTWWLRGRRK